MVGMTIDNLTSATLEEVIDKVPEGNTGSDQQDLSDVSHEPVVDDVRSFVH